MQALVYKIHSDFYYVKNSKHDILACKLRDVLKKQKIEIKVGDYVTLSDDCAFITSLMERKNTLNRPKVSNVDCAVVVCSIKEPDLDLVQLNRYLIYLKYYKIKTAICFNKEDLLEACDLKTADIKEIYEKLGYEIFFISAKNKSHLDKLQGFIKDKTIVLCGQSGVGKSTLLNSLNSDIFLRTGDVSSKTQRGCHTTRHCEIVECDGFKLIDTPGFSCLKFDFLLPEKLIELFDDIKEYSKECRYSDCLHNIQQQGICSVCDNLDKIAKSRYESYLCFLNEALEYKKTISKRSIKDEGFHKTTGTRLAVKISKRKRNNSRKTDKQNAGEIE